VRDISQGKLRQVIYLPGIHHITDNEDPGANPILVSVIFFSFSSFKTVK